MGISVDDAATVKKFRESLKAPFPFLSDDDATVAKRYGVYDAERDFARRVTFIVGTDGRVTHVERDRLTTDQAMAACPVPAPAPKGAK